MAWLSVDENEDECIFNEKPIRSGKYGDVWLSRDSEGSYVELPTGSIEKLIGRKLSWNDDAVEIK